MEKEDIIIITCVVIGVVLFAYNYFYVFSNYISLISIVLVIIGPSGVEYIKFKHKKEIEDNFPDFLRDVSSNIKAGMTLPKAISAVKGIDYGSLTPHVKKMAVQIDWGVPFNDILEGFSKKATPVVGRTVSTIIETHKGGGDIAKIFDTIGKSIVEMNKIKKERESNIKSQMVTGYIIFFVFIGVLVALEKFLIPNLLVATAEGDSVEQLTKLYSDMFRWLVLIQGFFSGLVIGKMSEGSLIAGLKHCLILVFVGYGIFLVL